MDEHWFLADILYIECAAQRAVGKHDIAEIVNGLVEFRNASYSFLSQSRAYGRYKCDNAAEDISCKCSHNHILLIAGRRQRSDGCKDRNFSRDIGC